MRFFRKWYFKIYHLLKLLGVFILIIIPTIVKAEEYNTCYDEYKIGNVELVYAGVGDYERLRPSLIVEPNKTYYIRFFPTGDYQCKNNNCINPNNTNMWNKNSQHLGTVTLTEVNYNITNNILSFKTPNNVNLYYLGLNIRTGASDTIKDVIIGTPFIMSDDIKNIESCNTTPEPPVPGDNVYSSFLTLYIDRINYLANGFTENPYLLSMIGIIIGFVVLELFLHIFHIKGGYKK